MTSTLRRAFDSATFRVVVVWAVVFGTYNTTGWSVAHFLARKLSEFHASSGLGSMSLADMNVAYFLAAVLAGVAAMWVGNMMHRGMVYGLVNIMVGFIIAMLIYVVLFAWFSGVAHRLNYQPALLALVVGMGTLFVWYFFYKIVTEIMGHVLFILSMVFFALVLTYVRTQTSWDVGVGTGMQVVAASVLSFGVLFAGVRRRLTGVGSVITPERATHHGPIGDGHHHGNIDDSTSSHH